MWVSASGTAWERKINACMRSIATEPIKAYLLPADVESIDAMVEQMAESMWGCGTSTTEPFPSPDKLLGAAYRKEARAALSAIGLHPRVPKS